MTTDTKNLAERVFRKMGAEIKPCLDYKGGKDIYSWQLNGEAISNSVHLEKYRDSLRLPPISSSWEVCAKYLVPFMREKEFDYEIQRMVRDGGKRFCWGMVKEEYILGYTAVNYIFHLEENVEIKDDKISEAACEAFMEVKLNDSKTTS